LSAEAIRAMSEQLAIDPTSLVFLPLAEALLARGELANAYRVARRGADRHAHRADVHDLVARIALAQGDALAAERAWKDSLAISADFGPAHRGLGFLCYQQERWADAEAHLARARQMTPNEPSLEAAWASLQEARRASAAETVLETAPVASAAESPAHDGALFDEALGDSSQVALLLDADGLVVAGSYATADGTDLGAVIGAHLSGVSDEAERAMRHFGLGAWTRILLESEAATLMMSPAQDGVTLVAAPREVPLGFVRRTLDQCQVLARRWLGEGV
jgi:predicted regulator of Ras-like GTPase activity (Roadblock/LC7/MglB family)